MHFQQQPVSAPWTAAECNGDVTSVLLYLFPCSSAQGFDGTGCCRVPSGGVCAVTFLCSLLFSMPSFIFFLTSDCTPRLEPSGATMGRLPLYYC